MSFLIYLFLFFTIPHLSTSFYPYGIIHNASIKIPFDVNDKHGHKSEGQDCEQCLCSAFNNSAVVLFTCTKNHPMNYICQFYYFMPKRDEIQYPRNDTSIYLIQVNATFEEKDDCCDTTYLIQQINEKLSAKQNFTGIDLRSVVESDNNTIVAVVSNPGGSNPQILMKFDKSNVSSVSRPNISSPALKAVGYYNGKYYLGTVDQNIVVYDENFTKLSDSPVGMGSAINTIRFINKTQEMVVGTAGKGVKICKIDENGGIPEDCPSVPLTETTEQLHAIGIDNDDAFYVGWAHPTYNIHLYTRDPNNEWTENGDGLIEHNEKTSDIVIDDCKRIWVVIAESEKIFIYHQNKTPLGEINVGTGKLFNLLILENYTLITSHEGESFGLTRIEPSLNCRPVRPKK